MVVEKLDLAKYDPGSLNEKQKMAYKRVKQWVQATIESNEKNTPPTQLLLQIQGKYIPSCNDTESWPSCVIIILFRQGWIWQELLSGLFTSLRTQQNEKQQELYQNCRSNWDCGL